MAFGYTRQQYIAKIDALEGYQEQLKTHLATLEQYREQIYDFWNDKQARTVYRALNKTTQNVKTAMDRCSEALVMHRKTVDTMFGISNIVTESAEAAEKAINLLE